MKIPNIKKIPPLSRTSEYINGSGPQKMDAPCGTIFKMKLIRYDEKIPIHEKIVIRNNKEQLIFDNITKIRGKLSEFEVISRDNFNSNDFKKREMVYRLENLEYKNEKETECEKSFEQILEKILHHYDEERDKIVYYDCITTSLSGHTAYALYRGGELRKIVIIKMS